jgi:molybdate transport system substrate-binding protein
VRAAGDRFVSGGDARAGGSLAALRDSAQAPLQVFAAGSLRSVFDALSEHWPALVEIRYANALVLAEAILAGDPADVFASASPYEPGRLAGLGLAGEGRVFAANHLVIAVAAGSDSDAVVPGSPSPGRASSIEMAGMPLGDYTRELLDNLGAVCGCEFAQGVLDNVVTQRDSVDAVSRAIYDGEADVAILYATDVAASAGRLRAIELPRAVAVPATYVVCALRAAAQPADAAVWIDLTLGPLGQRVLRAAGFTPPW